MQEVEDIIKVGTIPYEIIVTDEFDSDANGICDTDIEAKICIRPSLLGDRKTQIIWHEIVHAIFDWAGRNNNEKEVDLFANGILQFIQDNYDFIKKFYSKEGIYGIKQEKIKIQAINYEIIETQKFEDNLNSVFQGFSSQLLVRENLNQHIKEFHIFYLIVSVFFETLHLKGNDNDEKALARALLMFFKDNKSFILKHIKKIPVKTKIKILTKSKTSGGKKRT